MFSRHNSHFYLVNLTIFNIIDKVNLIYDLVKMDLDYKSNLFYWI